MIKTKLSGELIISPSNFYYVLKVPNNVISVYSSGKYRTTVLSLFSTKKN